MEVFGKVNRFNQTGAVHPICRAILGNPVVDFIKTFRVEAGDERRERKVAEESPLVRALGLAYHWRGLMESSRFKTLSEIAEAEGLDKGQVSRMMRLTRLAPDIVADVLAGKGEFRLERLMRQGVPRDWEEQRVM